MNYIYLLLILEIALFLLAFMLNKNDIMAPSVIMCAMFTVSTLFAILNIENWNINYHLESCFIIISGLFVFLLAETVFRVFFEKRRGVSAVTYKVETVHVQKWIVWAVILFDVTVLVLFFLRIRQITGLSGFNSLIFSTYRAMTVHLASRTNTDVEQAGIILNQLQKLVRATGFAVEYIIIKDIFEKKRVRQYAGLLIIMVLSVYGGMLVASRAVLIQLAVAGLVEYSIIWHQKHGWFRNISWKILRIAIVSLFAGIPIFHFTAQIIGEATKLDMFGYASVYLGSSIQLFDLFVCKPTKPVAFGEETLVGVQQFLDRLGISTYTRDVNLEFRQLSNDSFSNIYTFFRRPLHDFGYGGMLVFTVLVALLFTWFYYGKIKWKRPSRKLDSWILAYGYLYYWIFISSMDQGSQMYISLNSFTTILFIIIVYRIMAGIKIVIRNKTPVLTHMRKSIQR